MGVIEDSQSSWNRVAYFAGVWEIVDYRTVDFGTEGQIVSEEFS